jgi:hypothetical protein
MTHNQTQTDNHMTNQTQTKETLINAINKLVNNDPRITIAAIYDGLNVKQKIKATRDEIKSAIDHITANGIRSFANCPAVKRGHAEHMDRFMLLETYFRKIKSCTLEINAPNGAKYAVKFYAANGAVVKHWIGINRSSQQISFGYDQTGLSLVKFDNLIDRGQSQASTVAWILDEFYENGMYMASDLLNTFQFDIEFPTPNHLNTFNGFKCSATKIDGTVVDGKIDADDHGLQNHGSVITGIMGTIFHPWNQFKSITIFAKY